MSSAGQILDDVLRDRTPSQIVLITLGATITGKLAWDVLSNGRLTKRTYKAIMFGVRYFADPIVRKAVKKTAKGITMPSTPGEFKALVLPDRMHSEAEVLAIAAKLHEELDQPYEVGGFSGAVYHGGSSHTKFINDVMALFQWSNPLHSDIFGATRKMEAEVVSMVVHMYNGHLLPDACGAVTSGGSESIMMAMKTYRDWGRKKRGIRRASIVAPITAHPAFDKAAEYFDMELIKVPVNQKTMSVCPHELEKYIRFDTVAIIGSAPTFPHGAVDDIPTLAEIAYQHRLGLHVDCCLGGFIMPFLEKTGRAVPIVDFRNRGVTSISCDTHKYGYAPKGSSTVLYRTKELRSYQFCCVAEWPGGMYCSPAVSGSKPGNVIAGTWAAMVKMGLPGYVECCDKILSAREAMTTGIQKLVYMHLIGDPIASVFAFGSDFIDIYRMGDELTKRGWILNRLQFPPGLQFSVTLLQTNPGVVARFLHDTQEIGAALMDERTLTIKDGKKMLLGNTSGTMYGTAQRVPDRTIIQDILREYLSIYYTA